METPHIKSGSKHWDTIFANTIDTKLGWYESNPYQTLELLKQIPGWEKATIFIAGAGTSVLIDELAAGNTKLVLNDISAEALNRVKKRLGDSGRDITWLCRDIAQPVEDVRLNVDIWIDRAVLHFLTDEDDIKGYFENVRSILKIGGYAIFAEFSKVGAPKCAGLPVNRYSIEELSGQLGESFTLMLQFDYIYTNPNGDPRPYIYALYKREQTGKR